MEYDLKLLAGADDAAVEIEVFSQLMIWASLVFRKMLAPGRFAEGHELSSTGKACIKLPKDNGEAMKLLCDILHHRSTWSYQGQEQLVVLHGLAELADKYDCTKVIYSWVHLAMEYKELSCPEFEYLGLTELLQWIYISLHFGLEDSFSASSERFIKDSTKLDLEHGEHLRFLWILPEELQVNIKKTRRAVWDRIREICRTMMTEIRTGEYCEAPNDVDGETCRLVQLGSYVAALESGLNLDVWTLNAWEDLSDKTLAEYYSNALKVAKREFHRPWGGFEYDHQHHACRWSTDLEKLLRAAWSDVKGLELDSYRKR